MKLTFIITTALIILTTWFGYEMFMLYGNMMSVINNPICPETYYPPCVEKVCKKCGDEFSFQSCRYKIMCEHGGYCLACPKTFEEELRVCQTLLEELKNYVK